MLSNACDDIYVSSSFLRMGSNRVWSMYTSEVLITHELGTFAECRYLFFSPSIEGFVVRPHPGVRLSSPGAALDPGPRILP